MPISVQLPQGTDPEEFGNQLMGLGNPMAVGGLITGVKNYNKLVGAFSKLYSDKFGQEIPPSWVHDTLVSGKSLLSEQPNIEKLASIHGPDHPEVMSWNAAMDFMHTQLPEIMQALRRYPRITGMK